MIVWEEVVYWSIVGYYCQRLGWPESLRTWYPTYISWMEGSSYPLNFKELTLYSSVAALMCRDGLFAQVPVVHNQPVDIGPGCSPGTIVSGSPPLSSRLSHPLNLYSCRVISKLKPVCGQSEPCCQVAAVLEPLWTCRPFCVADRLRWLL